MNQPRQKRIHDSFKRSKDTYEEEARVQREVRERLLELVSLHTPGRFHSALEVGCCTGALSEGFCRQFFLKRYVVNDLVTSFCEASRLRIVHLCQEVDTLPGDIEHLAVSETFEMIISSSTFQWLHDLRLCLSRLAALLEPNGYLVFAMFGPGTMVQFKELVGIGLDYTPQAKVLEWLATDFELIWSETRHYRQFFSSGREVLHHIKRTGVGGAGELVWTPQRLLDFERRYHQSFATPEGLPLDYAADFVVAKRKRES